MKLKIGPLWEKSQASVAKMADNGDHMTFVYPFACGCTLLVTIVKEAPADALFELSAVEISDEHGTASFEAEPHELSELMQMLSVVKTEQERLTLNIMRNAFLGKDGAK
jgi:hypothetical protein